MRAVLTGFVLAFVLSGAAAQAQDACPFPIGGIPLTTSIECAAQMVDYRDDPLSFHLTADTAGFVEFASEGPGVADAWFMAAKHKNTGEVTVMFRFLTRSRNWLFANQVDFGDPLRSRPLERFASDTDCAGRGGCELTERFAATLSSEDVSALLDRPVLISFRLLTERGPLDGYIGVLELEAVLAKLGILDRYRSKAP
jgi:hypothetical protein